MPSLLRFLEPKVLEAFELDFYEQGIRRRIELYRIGQTLEVNCVSYGDSPLTEKSICEVASWGRMMSEFWEKFCSAVSAVAPQAIQHRWSKEWIALKDRKGVESRVGKSRTETEWVGPEH